MEAASYAALTRQSGLQREMQIIANNIANAATTGYRSEGVVFSEFVQRMGRGEALSMARGAIGVLSPEPGGLTETGAPFDLAIDGDGFFLVETARGSRLTRAGSFRPSASGDLVTPQGDRVLDPGGAPVFVPPDASSISVGQDGTISADGQALGQIGLVRPIDGADLRRDHGVLFEAPGGFEPADQAQVLAGHLEESNVDPVTEIARMIEVQRAYEMGQSFLSTEDERLRTAMQTLLK